MRILVDSSSYHALNLGDVAMVRAAVRRLREVWPQAEIQVVADAPCLEDPNAFGASYAPGSGRVAWFRRGSNVVFEGVDVPPPARRAPPGGPVSAAARLWLERLCTGGGMAAIREFTNALVGADLVVWSGRGGLTDAFLEDAFQVLSFIETTANLGIATALVGHSIGPVVNPELRRRCAEVLPRVDLITLRESSSSRPFLESLGVRGDRLLVTGDDALLVPAGLPRPRSHGRHAVGVNVRIASYSHVRREDASFHALSEALRHVLRRYGAEPLALPISRGPEDDDWTATRALLDKVGDPGAWPRNADDVVALIQHIDQCRVVVTGSYHAGLFALSRGVPAVALAASPYYLQKFDGLRDQFGGGCAVVDFTRCDAAAQIRREFDRAWHTPVAERSRLAESAMRQSASADAAYRRLPRIVRARATPSRKAVALAARTGERIARRRARVDGTPRTSVMMAAYNAEATVAESAASVLAQTVADIELIVVDDASRTPVAEALGELLRDPRLRVIRRSRNGGTASARNTALRAARAPLVSQLDADDLWEPDYVERILPMFTDPSVGLAYTNATILGHPQGVTTYIRDESVHPMYRFPKIAENNPVPCPTATIRAEAARATGGYASWLQMSEDYHLYLKLAARGWRFAYVDRPLARYRWPEPTRGMSFDRRRHEWWNLLMWTSFVARHPRTPGARLQVRSRLAREAKRLWDGLRHPRGVGDDTTRMGDQLEILCDARSLTVEEPEPDDKERED